MRSTNKIAAFIVLLAVICGFLQAGMEMPLHTKRLSDKVLIVWICDYMQQIATVALATEKGIVVIEASLIRVHDARIRQAIEKEFGRKDIKYLINTHFHHDHTAGNQIYADATIIGHKNTPAGMREELTGEGLVKLVDKFKGMQKDREEALKHLDPGSRDYKFTEEFIACLKLAIPELQNGFIPTYPTVLFEKNLILDMGDMTIELYSIGGMHTDSDIAIFVPEEGLVALGDVPPDQILPYIRKELKSDFSVTLENWGRIVDSGREIKYVNMAHSDMFISVETYKEQYKYLSTLWKGVSEMFKKGKTLEEAKKKYTVEKDFPYFKDRITKRRDIDITQYNIESIWEKITKEQE
ncbi:MAG: MBL fold metallo-hydrolase [Candidatus Aminicenantes bacterium]|nr:MAG: MBL fold metallo-hydrolase [Candidatus Aminicenantes bacterium]